MLKLIGNFHKQTYGEVKNFLYSSFCENLYSKKNIKIQEISKIQKEMIVQKHFDLVSIAMSFAAILNYKNGARYYQTLSYLNDAKYLANSSNSPLAQKLNIFSSGLIEYYEQNFEVAINLFNSSLYIKAQNDERLNAIIVEFKNKVNSENKLSSFPSFLQNEIKDEGMLALLQVGRTLSVETNIDSLLNIIAKQIQMALNADRCSVFLLDKEQKELWSKVATGLETKEIRFPIDKGLAGHVAKTGELINLKNAYDCEFFNKDIDIQTGYKTKNIICMPIRNLSHEIVGVVQVLNKKDGEFSQKDEDLLVAIGASAGIALENAELFDKQQKLIEEQKRIFSSFIDTLSASIDARDKITSGHSSRVTAYADLICNVFGLNESEKEKIKNASLLHDIGKIGIKDSILQKDGKLTDEEYKHIKDHVKFTHNILSKVCISKNFKEVSKIASSHHEKYDGSGYFKGLKGEEIPLGGRILAVCDVFDAITSRRHYRNKMDIKEVLKIMSDGKNKHFDEKIVNAFFSVSAYDILKIIVNNLDDLISLNEKNILREFNLGELYGIVNSEKESINDKQQELTEVFNKYYHIDVPVELKA